MKESKFSMSAADIPKSEFSYIGKYGNWKRLINRAFAASIDDPPPMPIIRSVANYITCFERSVTSDIVGSSGMVSITRFFDTDGRFE